MSVWEKIVDYTVPSNTTSVTLNNFGTITKNDFIKIHANIKNTSTSAGINISLFANADNNNSNYYFQQLQANGSAVSAARVNENRLTRVEPNIDASIFSYLKISENEKVNLFSNDFAQNNNLLRTKFLYTTSTNSFNNINQFILTSNISNTLGANSRIQIYRLTAEKVADITVSSNTTQVDITGLNIEKGSEYLLVGDWSGNTERIKMFVNNDTSSNYNTQLIIGSGSTSASVRFTGEPFWSYYDGLGPNINYTYIKLSNIGSFTAQAYETRQIGTPSNTVHNTSISGTLENLTSITEINLIHNQSNGIGSGSRFQLYKLY